ncbi:MarR family winged helix-turn-helix transcriptional regulator [Rhodococcus sp. NPDC056516]|uniref:MarR family winged helix-turn-helix transcriptional regulator n=1 Tax=unclassified Rhodococcus (in: high G+C Gram-positive bacteria) TaxID=192944 RepID=UPI00366EAFBA
MESTRWLTDSEQTAWRAYLDSTRLLQRVLDQQLVHDSDISFTDFELLVALAEAPGRQLRMSELADAVMATRSGVTRAVNRLVGVGWVRRVECVDDKRGANAELTDQGAEKLASASPAHVAAVRKNMFDLLSPRDVERLGVVFGEMRRHLLEGQSGN